MSKEKPSKLRISQQRTLPDSFHFHFLSSVNLWKKKSADPVSSLLIKLKQNKLESIKQYKNDFVHHRINILYKA